MQIRRPITAQKNNINLKRDHYKQLYTKQRPRTASPDSLKTIIQIIQKTLKMGTKTSLIKPKVIDKINKSKTFDFIHMKHGRRKTRVQKDESKISTQLIIRCSSSQEPIQSKPIAKSAKILAPSSNYCPFIPYNKQIEEKKSSEQWKGIIKKQGLKKWSRERKIPLAKTVKQSNQQQPLGQWENDISFLNLSSIMGPRLF